jgi:hypothetical protein
MDLKQEQFSAGDLVQVLRVDDTILQNWLRRSNLKIPTLIGGRRLFSAQFAIQLAVLKELNLYGMGPVQAGGVIESLIDLTSVAGGPTDWTRWLEQITVDDLVLHRPKGGNSLEDVRRGSSEWGFAKRGSALLLNADSGLVLAVGAIAKKVMKQLEGILRLREAAKK